MKQLIQNFKTGKIYVDELPAPSLQEGFVLVENRFSLISAGTERSTVKTGQASLLGKARQRPDLVKQVLQNLQKEGLKATYKKVRTKLDSLKALGYSSSGVVLSSLDKAGEFKPGDRVACGGQDYASHAEIISVPQNLTVKIPDNVSFEQAAFTTLGAIAMQGVRQADVHIGEKIAVIGLGLLGQITGQLLKANGAFVFGIDLSPDMLELAKKTGFDATILRSDDALFSTANLLTDGHGFDKVIITAAAPNNDPVILATELARKKGVIVVVGAVPMNIPRNPHFYPKELELRISTSYGPGRYDPLYEELGNDYPYAYVRWTEKRNMQAFLELISQGQINMQPLISHIFDIEEATKAYDLVLGKTKEKYTGILLKYHPDSQSKKSQPIRVNHNPVNKINVGIIGAGSFAQNYLIPNIKKFGASLETVVNTKSTTSKNVAQKFGFNFASTNPDDIFKNKKINTVFIATPHHLHASYTIKALENNKHVFVEKPLAINIEELKAVEKAFMHSKSILSVGFNRRFSPLSKSIYDEFISIQEPKIVNIRINAGFIPKDHWIQNPEIGGGRIIGEVCHFIDLIQFFTDSFPVRVFAQTIKGAEGLYTQGDNVAIILEMNDGSLGNIVYTANGDPSLPKELIEVFGGGKVGRILNFRNGEIYSKNKRKKLKMSGKGHHEEVFSFLNAISKSNVPPIPFRSIVYTTLSTFKIHDSLATGLPQNITWNFLTE